MKTLTIILFASLLATSCSKKQEKINAAYIVEDSTVTTINTRMNEFTRMYTGGTYHITVAQSFKTSAKDIKLAYEAGLIKSGLNLDIMYSYWGVGNRCYKKEKVFTNAIYIEKGGKICSVPYLYICSDESVTEYSTNNRTISVKQLSPIQINDLPKNIRDRINNNEIFIIAE